MKILDFFRNAHYILRIEKATENFVSHPDHEGVMQTSDYIRLMGFIWYYKPYGRNW